MNKELAKRAVTCKHWRWMPGMLTINGTRIQRTPNVEITAAWPDLDDPATLGCLLALVREARSEPWYHPAALGDASDLLWVSAQPSHMRQTRYTTEAEALVAALEAAPTT